MSYLIELLRRLAAKLGYRLIPIGAQMPEPPANEESPSYHFTNLVESYELRLIESGYSLRPDGARPKLLCRLIGTPPSEAFYIIEALTQVRTVVGDVCEFGVAEGETSALIAHEIINDQNKILHLFDSFEGLPKPSAKDQLKNDIFSLGSMEAYAGTMACPEERARSRLDALPFPRGRYVMHKGFFDKILQSDPTLPHQVSFAYVDFDLYEPICLVLQFLDERTPSGARIIVDDYDFFSTGAKTAVDEFLQQANEHQIRYDCLIPDTRYGHFAVLTKR